MKKSENLKRIFSALFCAALIAAAALTTGCGDKNESSSSSSSAAQTTAAVTTAAETDAAAPAAADAQTVGEGKVSFNFNVTGKDGKQTAFIVNTDKATVGEALVDNKLVEGENGDYGLYVKTVNGETLDFDKDGYYWALYIDGQYAQTGVDSTPAEAGKTYEFKAEKG